MEGYLVKKRKNHVFNNFRSFRPNNLIHDFEPNYYNEYEHEFSEELFNEQSYLQGSNNYSEEPKTYDAGLNRDQGNDVPRNGY